MKPWFEKELVEADIIDFPDKKPQGEVAQMPNIAGYPDFLTGVQDLQAKLEQGQISQESFNKLYGDLILRFKRNEDVENPWFIKEQGITATPDQLQKVAQQGVDNPKSPKFLQNTEKLDPKQFMYVNKMISNLITKKTTTGQLRGAVPQVIARLKSQISTYIRIRDDVDAIKNSILVVDAIMKAGQDKDGQTDVNVLEPWLEKFRVDAKSGGIDYIGAEKILPAGGLLQKTSVDNLIRDPIAKKVYDYLLKHVKTNKKNDAGPGEAAIAILCPYITMAKSATEGGDLIFSTDGGQTGRNIEVKTDAGSIYPVTGKFALYPNFQAELNADYKGGKIKIFGRKQTKDKKTGKIVTKVKGNVITVDQYATFLDGGKQRSDAPLKGKGDDDYMRTEFIEKLTRAWFDADVKLDVTSGQAFKRSWATTVFNYYKTMNNHEGILLVDKQGFYRYFVDGAQIMPEDLQLRSLYWTNQRGQSRGDKPGFKEVGKRKQ